MGICDEELHEAPAPSTLYSLRPMGINTTHVESLPSCMMRISMAHSVTVGSLVINEIIPRLKLNYYLLDGRTSNFYLEIKRLYSTSMLSSTLTPVLEDLTGNDDLKCLHFNISDCFSKSGVFQDFRAWCPHCLEEMKSEGGVIYELLIWNFSIVEFCKKHKYPLQTKCPNCRQKIQLLTPTSIPGYCSKCRCWLGDINNYQKHLYIEKDQWHQWVYDNIAELICESPRIPEIENNNFIYINLKKIVNHFPGSLRKFAQAIDFPYRTLYSWVKGNVRPNLNLLLGLSYCVSLTIKQIATELIDIDSTGTTLLRQKTKNCSPEKKTIDRELCEQTLNSAISDSFPPSILEIARKLSINPETLRYHFPEKVRDIVAKRRELTRKKSLLKELEQQQEIERTVIKIYQRGKYPNRRAVSDEMGKGWLYKKKSNYEAWERAILSLGLTLT